MAEEKDRAGGAVAGKGPVVIRLDPGALEALLFRKFQEQVVAVKKIKEILRALEEQRTGPEQVAALVHLVMRQYVGPLLGYVIPPETGGGIVKDRIVQIASLLLTMLRERIIMIENEILEAIREGKDYEVKRKVRELVNQHDVIMKAMREIMNRFLTLYQINLPPAWRPPLVHLKTGTEIIGSGEK